eukprot:5376790-Amphidinium_carterae.1
MVYLLNTIDDSALAPTEMTETRVFSRPRQTPSLNPSIRRVLPDAAQPMEPRRRPADGATIRGRAPTAGPLDLGR